MNTALNAQQEQTNIVAERIARQTRIDRDKIVATALDLMEVDYLDRTADLAVSRDFASYVAGSADLDLSAFGEPADARAYVTGLLADIRASLSPLALGINRK